MEINNLFLNQNSTLLSCSTNHGYRIFETFNFMLVSEENEYNDFLGALDIVIPYYESKLVFFVGSNDNLNFPSNHLVLWDDCKRKKLGIIMLKDKILNLKVTQHFLYIEILNKVILK